jgi:methionine-R-sulfoxide reductase
MMYKFKKTFVNLALLFKLIFYPQIIMAKDKKIDTSHLSELQKYVTLENGTEQPFNNQYWDHKQDGIYVDVIDGSPLFLSIDKFDSGTGWPSFSTSIDKNQIKEKTDDSLFSQRIEVRSKSSDAHLGHVFDDGPKDKGGKRYCINSAALKFIAKEDLKDQGYEKYLKYFK